MKYLILLMLLAMCHGCAPMAASLARQNSNGWEQQRQQRAADQWQTQQIETQRQTQQQNDDWWKNRK